MRTLLLSLTVALLVPFGTARAQAGTGGFKAGDLYLVSTAIDALSGGGGIVHVDPGTGQVNFLHDLQVAPGQRGGIAYDPYRDRLVFHGGFVPNSAEFWLSDAAGNLESLGFATSAGPAIRCLAPRGDGKIYCVWYGNSGRISYLDADDTMKTLLDASGNVYVGQFPGLLYGMHYDSGTNQLILSIHSNGSDCPGEVSGATNVHFLQLSADGARVLSETCAPFEASSTLVNERCEGMAQGPDGDVILVLSTDGSGYGQRMARVDPVNHAVTTYATNDYAGAGILRGGTYSPYLGKAIYMDPFNDVVRAHGPGEGGAGTVIASGGVSLPGTSSEVAALTIVAPAASLSGLTADVTEVSLSSGGTQTLSIDFDAAQAGRLYLLLGSATGWAPGLTAGTEHLPLNVDNYFLYTLFTPNALPLAGSLAFLDGAGQGTTTFTLPAGTDPSLAGAVLHHAASALDLAFVTQRTSNPVPVALVP